MRGYVVLAGLALLAAASSRPNRRRNRALNPLDRAKEAEALPPAHVGRDEFEWPMRDRFPTPTSFQEVLRSLGYEVEVDGNVLSEESRGAVSAFQLDWNVVSRAFEFDHEVETTGFIDVETVPAISIATKVQDERANDWFNIVGEALDLLRPEVG